MTETAHSEATAEVLPDWYKKFCRAQNILVGSVIGIALLGAAGIIATVLSVGKPPVVSVSRCTTDTDNGNLLADVTVKNLYDGTYDFAVEVTFESLDRHVQIGAARTHINGVRSNQTAIRTVTTSQTPEIPFTCHAHVIDLSGQ